MGENTIKVKVTKGSASQTYTLKVTRAAPAASSDASLSGLALSGVTLDPVFAGATTGYTASVYNSVESITVTATPNHAAATVVITPVDDADLSAEGYQVSLDVGSNVVSVKVTAEDGTTTRTYTVTVTRAANSATVVVTAPDGATDGTRAFEVTWVDTQDCTDGYKAYLGLVSNGVVVGATEIVDDATGTADVITATYDRLVNVGVVQVWCGERGSGRMVGEVAVPSNAATNNRVIPGRYSSAAGEPPTLSGLTVSAGTLTPTFAGGTLEYAVPGLAYGNNRITVTATADADATVSYEDGAGAALSDVDAATAGDQFDLAVGENTIKVRVTEGGLSQTYTLTLTRTAPAVSVSAAAGTAGEGDALTFTVTRTPAAGDALTLTVNVAESGDLVPAASEGAYPVTIAANATAATMTVATGADDSDWEEHSTVSVTAPSSAGYTLGVATASTLVEDDDFPAAEAVLTVSPATVGEPGAVSVSVTVTTNADQEPHGPGGTVTATAGGGTATSGSDYDAFSPSYTLNPDGFSVVTVGGSQRWQRVYTGTVAVRDDTTQESAETFNVALTKSGAPKVTLASPSTVAVTIRANDAPTASSDASLSALSLSSGTLSPVFAAATTSYAASVANNVSSTTVTATKNHAAADVLITPTDADTNRDGHQVNLNVGSNAITVKVTAEDGATRTYTVTVTRAAPQDITLHSNNGNPTGIWSDGTTIWVADTTDDKLYAYALADGARQDGTGSTTNREFDLHGDNNTPATVWSNGATIWVSQGFDLFMPDADNKLYAYALADGTRQDGRNDRKELDLHSDNGHPEGIWSNGSTIWVADIADDKLYAYGLKGGHHRDGRDIALHRNNDNPRGIWSDGDTIWVADSGDDKLYAYDLYKGTRRADLDLDLDSENSFPLGIWSDGDTIWVVDLDDDKLYAYGLPKQPALSVRAMAPQIVYESQVTVTVTIRAETARGAAAPASAFDVTAHTEEGTAKLKTDYIPFSAKITFDPADFTLWGRQYRASKRVQFRIVGDITHESDEQLTIVVASSPSTPSGVPLESATITIRDDDEPRSPSNARQPRITYAVYDADLDAVVLEWAAGSDTDGLTGFKIEREAPTGTTAMVHADLIDDERPMLESSVLSMNDETAPASWVVFYRVWAVFSSGREVVSWWFPATMDRGIVRARITIEGSNVRFDVSWTDGLYYPDDGAGHDGFCSEGYKVYEQSNLGGFERWVDVTAVDTDPAERTHTVTTATTAYAKGAKIPYRVRCGGTSATTGLLIGEDTATVQ